MRLKLSKKKISLIVVGALAVLAVGAAAYVHYHRPASSGSTQGVKPDTSDTADSDGSDKTTSGATGNVSPTPIPAPTPEGKPQSEATNPNPSGLTVTLTYANAQDGAAAIINKVASGSCLFSFTKAGSSPEQATTLLQNPNNLSYSSCNISVDVYVGWTVKVTATVDGVAVTSNSMVITAQ